jgi:hypothetical protein
MKRIIILLIVSVLVSASVKAQHAIDLFRPFNKQFEGSMLTNEVFDSKAHAGSMYG